MPSDVKSWSITISGALNICSWIDDLGGPTSINFTNLINIIQHFTNQTKVDGYNFIPTFKDTYGTIQYWNNNISGGNTTTGCDF